MISLGIHLHISDYFLIKVSFGDIFILILF